MRMQKSREDYSAAAAGTDRVRVAVPADCAGERLDRALARLFPAYSRSRLARWARDGRITVDGRVLAPRHKLIGGEAIELVPTVPEETLAHRGENLPLDPVHEDGAILVVNKP